MATPTKTTNGKADNLDIPAALKRAPAGKDQAPSYEQLMEMVQQQQQAMTLLQAQLQAKSTARLKISEKGAVSLYGVAGRFPITLYATAWIRVLDMGDQIRQFIDDNRAKLSFKE